MAPIFHFSCGSTAGVSEWYASHRLNSTQRSLRKQRGRGHCMEDQGADPYPAERVLQVGPEYNLTNSD